MSSPPDPAHTRRVIAIVTALQLRTDAAPVNAHLMMRAAYPELAARWPCGCDACAEGRLPNWGG